MVAPGTPSPAPRDDERAPSMPFIAPDTERPPRAPSASSEWYGWQTLSVDVAAIGLFVLANSTHEVGFGALGLGTYVLGAPLVQFAHDNAWAAPSLGLRVGSLALIVAGAYVGLFACLSDNSASDCGTREAIGGAMMLAGLLTVPVAIVLDTVMARTKVAPHAADTPQFGMWVDPAKGALGFSLQLTR
jgi:hypothetical protein